MQHDGVFVENFAIRRRSPEEMVLVRKVRVIFRRVLVAGYH